MLNCATPQTVLDFQDCAALVASTSRKSKLRVNSLPALFLRKQPKLGQDVTSITNKLSSLHEISKNYTETCHTLSPAARRHSRALHHCQFALAPLHLGILRRQVSRRLRPLTRLISVKGHFKLTEWLDFVVLDTRLRDSYAFQRSPVAAANHTANTCLTASLLLSLFLHTHLGDRLTR